MKTQNSNLVFSKNVLVELNDNQLENVNGGSEIILRVVTWVMDVI